jgi:ribose 5-phosphate isomerase A
MNVPSIETRSDQDRAKLAAGRFAAEKYAFDGAKLGLGSGTTSHYFVRALAQRVAEGLDVVGATTSTSTTELARELGVPLADIDDIDRLDVCIDGPDEIDVEGNQIKGGGACLLWEKLVVMKADKSVVVADHTKAVPRLGRFPLPIEIVRYAPGTTTAAIRTLLTENGYPADLELVRRSRNGEEVITDNGNYIVDAHLGKVRDIGRLTVELNRIPGVVENGFFYGTVDEVVFGWPDGSAGIFDFPFGLPLEPSHARDHN